MLPTTNILQRTFLIRCGETIGTCFTIDVHNRQYIITARHVGASISGPSTVKLQHEGVWKDLAVRLVGHGLEEVDVTVLATDLQLSPTHPLPAGLEGISLGQDVLFLGFPYGLTNEAGQINRNFPLPLVKHGIVSAMLLKEVKTILLDGHNNPGFSGGPVVCEVMKGQSKELTVIGVISGYRHEPKAIYQDRIVTTLKYYENTGIVIVFGIEHALDLIKKNPIGFNLAHGKS